MTKTQRKRSVFRKRRNSELAHRIEMGRQRREQEKERAFNAWLNQLSVKENLEAFEKNNAKKLLARHNATPAITYLGNGLPPGKVEVYDSAVMGMICFAGEGVRLSF